VVALLTDLGKQVEHVRYSAYGEPFTILPGDADSNGNVSTTEEEEFAEAQSSGSPYHVLYDSDLDNDVDANDAIGSGTLGYGALSSVENRLGYAGYAFDDNITRFAHVRHRVLDTTLGRWTRRDPLGYVDGGSAYEYARSRSIDAADPTGLCTSCVFTSGPSDEWWDDPLAGR
jgi:RHS repeat-associated protein